MDDRRINKWKKLISGNWRMTLNEWNGMQRAPCKMQNGRVSDAGEHDGTGGDKTAYEQVSDEWVDIVDEYDRVVDRQTRRIATERRLRHRCVFIFVRDGEDRIFVHRRTDSKLVFPGRYDMFVGGVVGAGETYADAALREAEEELGVAGLPAPVPLFSFLYESPEHTWWSRVFEVRCTPPVHPQAEEIAWSAFVTDDELARRLPEWHWTPDALEAYRRLTEWRRTGDPTDPADPTDPTDPADPADPTTGDAADHPATGGAADHPATGGAADHPATGDPVSRAPGTAPPPPKRSPMTS
jgi:8-oxo-dGTP pyrophosphatase MutT (NUDIX family)